MGILAGKKIKRDMCTGTHPDCHSLRPFRKVGASAGADPSLTAEGREYNMAFRPGMPAVILILSFMQWRCRAILSLVLFIAWPTARSCTAAGLLPCGYGPVSLPDPHFLHIP